MRPLLLDWHRDIDGSSDDGAIRRHRPRSGHDRGPPPPRGADRGGAKPLPLFQSDAGRDRLARLGREMIEQAGTLRNKVLKIPLLTLIQARRCRGRFPGQDGKRLGAAMARSGRSGDRARLLRPSLRPRRARASGRSGVGALLEDHRRTDLSSGPPRPCRSPARGGSRRSRSPRRSSAGSSSRASRDTSWNRNRRRQMSAEPTDWRDAVRKIAWRIGLDDYPTGSLAALRRLDPKHRTARPSGGWSPSMRRRRSRMIVRLQRSPRSFRAWRSPIPSIGR